MNRKLLTVFGCLGALLGLALLLDVISKAFAEPTPLPVPVPTCDDKYASNSVGSCAARNQCNDGNGSATLCTEITGSYAEVMQNFPTDCVYLKDTKKNCNVPDANCWRNVKCKYAADTKVCSIDTDKPTGAWNVMPKKTTVSCPP